MKYQYKDSSTQEQNHPTRLLIQNTTHYFSIAIHHPPHLVHKPLLAHRTLISATHSPADTPILPYQAIDLIHKYWSEQDSYSSTQAQFTTHPFSTPYRAIDYTHTQHYTSAHELYLSLSLIACSHPTHSHLAPSIHDELHSPAHTYYANHRVIYPPTHSFNHQRLYTEQTHRYSYLCPPLPILHIHREIHSSREVVVIRCAR